MVMSPIDTDFLGLTSAAARINTDFAALEQDARLVAAPQVVSHLTTLAADVAVFTRSLTDLLERLDQAIVQINTQLPPAPAPAPTPVVHA